MKAVNDKKVKRWIEQNVLLELNQLTPEDAEVWLQLAEEETWMFFRLTEYALRLRRQRMQQPSPCSRREVLAFYLEFRVKVQMVRDHFQELPKVPLFDFGGDQLFDSVPFQEAKMLYAGQGGFA